MKIKTLSVNRNGFTLIELMIVIVIIGIIAISAYPKMANSLTRAKEGKLRANLANLRSAVDIYYSDTEGQYPLDLTAALTTGQKYIDKIPKAEIPAVSSSGNPGHSLRGGVSTVMNDMAGGAWLYTPSGPKAGDLVVNCLHLDSTGEIWSLH